MIFFTMLLKRLKLGSLVILFACAHQSPVQTGVYFYKGYVSGGFDEGAAVVDFTFEMTASVCELVISAKGLDESYFCTVKKHRNHSVSVYFESYHSIHGENILGAHHLAHGEKMFTLRLQQGKYVTQWAKIYPNKQNARSGTYFLHTYQK